MTDTLAENGTVDGRRPPAQLFRDLRTSADGLGAREAARRLTVYGPNELTRRAARTWPAQLRAQFTQPLAVLLMVAAVLAWLGGAPELAWAVVAVILLNAGFAFAQERQAERAVEALAAYLPATARALRDGVLVEVPARDLVPGDVIELAEGDRVCADGRLLDGELTLDLSALNGESVPAARTADADFAPGPLLEARELVFSGTACLTGLARAVVTHTGMHSEIGRIAALSQRGGTGPSPLERQVRRATWIIAAVAVAAGAAFLPIGVVSGLGWAAAISFTIGLIVANVPEGLLPTITLALAGGVRELARDGALVKRLSAVETLGSTTVICTDKTGTLTENRMRVARLWLPGTEVDPADPRAGPLAYAAALCTTTAADAGDPTELALLRLAADLRLPVQPADRDRGRRALYAFDARLMRMTTVDGTEVHTKGALESVLPLCTQVRLPGGEPAGLSPEVLRSARRRSPRSGTPRRRAPRRPASVQRLGRASAGNRSGPRVAISS